MIFDQSEFDIRCEWGEHGVSLLAPNSDVVIIVDVLSFSTSVDIAVSQGAMIFPYEHRNEQASVFAAEIGAELSVKRGAVGYSLSPLSMMRIPHGTRFVLVSPNGAALSLSTGDVPTTITGCLRNARAVAEAAQWVGKRISVIPAGERWEDGTLRLAFEDLIGAGAILSSLKGNFSPEARGAVGVFHDLQADIPILLKQCISGKELIERGYEQDILLAAELNASSTVPVLSNGAFIALKNNN